MVSDSLLQTLLGNECKGSGSVEETAGSLGDTTIRAGEQLFFSPKNFHFLSSLANVSSGSHQPDVDADLHGEDKAAPVGVFVALCRLEPGC